MGSAAYSLRLVGRLPSVHPSRDRRGLGVRFMGGSDPPSGEYRSGVTGGHRCRSLRREATSWDHAPFCLVSPWPVAELGGVRRSPMPPLLVIHVSCHQDNASRPSLRARSTRAGEFRSRSYSSAQVCLGHLCRWRGCRWPLRSECLGAFYFGHLRAVSRRRACLDAAGSRSELHRLRATRGSSLERVVGRIRVATG